MPGSSTQQTLRNFVLRLEPLAVVNAERLFGSITMAGVARSALFVNGGFGSKADLEPMTASGAKRPFGRILALAYDRRHSGICRFERIVTFSTTPYMGNRKPTLHFLRAPPADVSNWRVSVPDDQLFPLHHTNWTAC